MTHPTYGKVGLLLNGGGAKGIIQAGELMAFVNHGIEYDAIYGSSVGSLNGAMLHQGALHDLHEMWMSIRTSDVYTWNLLDLLYPLGKKGCLYDSSPLRKLLNDRIDIEYLRQNPRQFYIAATNFSTWSPLILGLHELEDSEVNAFLHASASPPYYFPLVNFRGNLLGDAGVVTNYNIAKAVEDGCDTLVIMGFAIPEPRRPANIKEVISETLSISMYGYFDRELSFVEKLNQVEDKSLRKIKVVKIVPDKPTGIGLLDFDYKQDREELWEYGFDLAASILKEQLPNAI